ncbi:sugar O-acetyltransferase [Carnobacterium gallinarum]|uniref:sugar O-acetyltransferase n=1 Tax=Carnobacterium gallinarum TaxID=2749 RepID=UPI0005577751|nr:sugar O-acetyltransferase [Carnobacterium gallinarum]
MKSEKEKMLAEELYLASDEELVADVKRSRRLTRLFNSTTEEQLSYRQDLLKELFAKTGEKIYIEPPFYCDYGSNIEIGENFYANFDCVILDVAAVEIGRNVMFGPKVNLFTAGHPVDPAVRISGLEFGRKITIGDNVWIGGNTSVNPGVKIGANTVIGSGSVVTKDIPENVIAAGNPCRVLRQITAKDTEFWEKQQKSYWADATKKD